MKSDSKDSRKTNYIWLFIITLLAGLLVFLIKDYNITSIANIFNKKSHLIGGNNMPIISQNSYTVPKNVENLIDNMLNKF